MQWIIVYSYWTEPIVEQSFTGPFESEKAALKWAQTYIANEPGITWAVAELERPADYADHE